MREIIEGKQKIQLAGMWREEKERDIKVTLKY